MRATNCFQIDIRHSDKCVSQDGCKWPIPVQNDTKWTNFVQADSGVILHWNEFIRTTVTFICALCGPQSLISCCRFYSFLFSPSLIRSTHDRSPEDPRLANHSSIVNITIVGTILGVRRTFERAHLSFSPCLYTFINERERKCKEPWTNSIFQLWCDVIVSSVYFILFFFVRRRHLLPSHAYSTVHAHSTLFYAFWPNAHYAGCWYTLDMHGNEQFGSEQWRQQQKTKIAYNIYTQM